ncbi:MAG: hypothetical protein ACRD0V_14400 [Acidimicrobiales bacterium]
MARQLANTLAAFIADGAKARVFHADDPAFSAQFVLYGLHGVLVSFLHDRAANRAEFIASCRATVRQLLGVSTRRKGAQEVTTLGTVCARARP